MPDNRGVFPCLPCWGRIPAVLRQCGATIYLGGQDAYGSIENNAAKLAEVVDQALAQENASRVNIIAHSKGGLEARYLVSSLQYADKVASLTLLAAPNRGATGAETTLTWRGFRLWARRNDKAWLKQGDRNPDTLLATEQLTANYLRTFNQENPDADGVYYQSWGAHINKDKSDRIMAFSSWLFYRGKMDNDGLVTPESARWGKYRGTLVNVSHRALVDAYGYDFPNFQPTVFHMRLVRELAEMGF